MASLASSVSSSTSSSAANASDTNAQILSSSTAVSSVAAPDSAPVCQPSAASVGTPSSIINPTTAILATIGAPPPHPPPAPPKSPTFSPAAPPSTTAAVVAASGPASSHGSSSSASSSISRGRRSSSGSVGIIVNSSLLKGLSTIKTNSTYTASSVSSPLSTHSSSSSDSSGGSSGGSISSTGSSSTSSSSSNHNSNSSSSTTSSDDPSGIKVDTMKEKLKPREHSSANGSHSSNGSSNPSQQQQPKPIGGPRLVDYVAIYQPETSNFQSTGRGTGPILLDGETKMGGELLYRMPEKDHSPDEAFPDGAAPFVFPFYARLYIEPVSRFFHSFVLTLQNGDRLYAYCVTMYSPLDQDKLCTVRMQLAARVMAQDDPSIDQLPDVLWSPKAFCLISQYPFHNTFTRFLVKFAQLYCPDDVLQPVHADVAYELLNSVKPPVAGGDPVWFPFSDTKFKLQIPAYSKAPLADLNYRTLFRLLEPKHIITVFNALLCEKSVLVLSSSIDVLTPCIETLVSLLYPMRWPYVYIPVLPLSLTYIFQVPQPYLIGSLCEALNEPPWPENAVIVDLDNNNITSPQSFDLLPWTLTWRLYHCICKHVPFFQFYHPTATLTPPGNLPGHADANEINGPDTPATARMPLSKGISFRGNRKRSVLTFKTMNDLYSGSSGSSSDEASADTCPSPLWIDPGDLNPIGESPSNSRAARECSDVHNLLRGSVSGGPDSRVGLPLVSPRHNGAGAGTGHHHHHNHHNLTITASGTAGSSDSPSPTPSLSVSPATSTSPSPPKPPIATSSFGTTAAASSFVVSNPSSSSSSSSATPNATAVGSSASQPTTPVHTRDGQQHLSASPFAPPSKYTFNSMYAPIPYENSNEPLDEHILPIIQSINQSQIQQQQKQHAVDHNSAAGSSSGASTPVSGKHSGVRFGATSTRFVSPYPDDENQSVSSSSSVGPGTPNSLGSAPSTPSSYGSSGDGAGDANDGSSPLINVAALRKGFLSVFVSLLKGYRDFLQIPKVPDMQDSASADVLLDTSQLFDSPAFLNFSAKHYVAYLEKFLNTQMFQCFVEDRLMPLSPDWFDIYVLEKMKRQNMRTKANARRHKTGVMWKIGGQVVQTWNERYFELDKMKLAYFRPNDKLVWLEKKCRELAIRTQRFPHDITLAAEYENTVKDHTRLRQREHCGEIMLVEGETKITIPEGQKELYKTEFVFQIVTPSRTWLLCCNDSETRRQWIKVLRARIVKSPEVLYRQLHAPTEFQDILENMKRTQTSQLRSLTTIDEADGASWVDESQQQEEDSADYVIIDKGAPAASAAPTTAEPPAIVVTAPPFNAAITTPNKPDPVVVGMASAISPAIHAALLSASPIGSASVLSPGGGLSPSSGPSSPVSPVSGGSSPSPRTRPTRSPSVGSSGPGGRAATLPGSSKRRLVITNVPKQNIFVKFGGFGGGTIMSSSGGSGTSSNVSNSSNVSSSASAAAVGSGSLSVVPSNKS